MSLLPIDLIPEVLFLIFGALFVGYLIGRDKRIDDEIKHANIAIKIAAGFIRRYDQSLFSDTLRKKVNAPLVGVPEEFI